MFWLKLIHNTLLSLISPEPEIMFPFPNLTEWLIGAFPFYFLINIEKAPQFY